MTRDRIGVALVAAGMLLAAIATAPDEALRRRYQTLRAAADRRAAA